MNDVVVHEGVIALTHAIKSIRSKDDCRLGCIESCPWLQKPFKIKIGKAHLHTGHIVWTSFNFAIKVATIDQRNGIYIALIL